VQIGNNRPITIQGNSLNNSTQAKTLLQRAGRNSYVVFTNVRSVGVSNASFSRTTKKALALKIQD
jgi:hypothetical protein